MHPSRNNIYSDEKDTLARCIRNKLRLGHGNGKEMCEQSRPGTKSSSESESGGRVKLSLAGEFDLPAPLNSNVIIRNLERGRTKNEKLRTLRAVLLQSQSECASYSADLLPTLQELLSDDDEHVFDLTLAIHEQLMRRSRDTLKDAYVNLLEGLYVHCFDLEVEHATADRYPHRNAFRICKLVLNTLAAVLAHVSGIGQARLELIVGNFVDLLFFTTATERRRLTPLHVVCALDPRARWCGALVHAASSRQVLFRRMARNKNIVAGLFLVISDWMCHPLVPGARVVGDGDGGAALLLSPAVVRYSAFVSCMRCCSRLSAYGSFYRLFPVVVEANFVISLRSFVVSLVSFVKSSRSRAVSRPVADAVLDCCVRLLAHQPADALVAQLQSILEMCDGSRARQYLLQVVRRVLEDAAVVDATTDGVMYARAGSNAAGRPMRPSRLYSSATRNVFACLAGTMARTLRAGHQSLVGHALGVCQNVLRSHKFYLLCGPHGYLLRELVELLAAECDRRRPARNGAVSRVTRDEDFVFAMGSTPLGFYFVASSQSLGRAAMAKLEKVDHCWLHTPWKNMVSHLIGYEFQFASDNILKKMGDEMLSLVQKYVEFEDANQTESSGCVDDILIFVDTFSNSLKGIRSLLTQTHATEKFVVKNVATFVESYALTATHEYKLKRLALQFLRIMTSNINAKLFLLCYFEYETRLTDIQDNTASSNDRLIKDECSALRAELIRSKTNYCGQLHYSNGVQSSPKVKLARRKLSEIEKILQNTRHGPFDDNWLKQARKCYKMSLSNTMKMSVMLELMEKICKSVTRCVRVVRIAPRNSVDVSVLHREDLKGIQLAVRFGLQNQMLQENVPNEENLTKVIRTVRAYVGHRDSENFKAFDATLATFFIMCGGSMEKSLHVVACVIPLPVSTYVWPQVAPNYTRKKYLFGHLTEWLLSQEVPNVFAALAKYGISWWLICKRKLENCFWDTLVWIEIYRWICITLLHDPDNLIYYFTSVAFKNEKEILQTTRELELRNLLYVSFSSHQLAEHIVFMEYLRKKYHSYLSYFLMD